MAEYFLPRMCMAKVVENTRKTTHGVSRLTKQRLSGL